MCVFLLYVFLSVYLSFVYASLSGGLSLYAFLSVRFLYPYVYLSASLSICLSVCLCMCLFMCVSIKLWQNKIVIVLWNLIISRQVFRIAVHAF